MTLKELMEKRAEALKTAAAIRAGAKASDRSMTEEEVKKMNVHLDEVEKLAVEIKAIEDADQVEARLAQANVDTSKPSTAPKKAKIDADLDPETRIEVGEDNALKDPKLGFKTFGEFLSVVAEGMTPGKKTDERLAVVMAAAQGMQQAVGVDGGFLVPPSFSNTIWDGLRNDSDNLMNMTTNFTVEGESLTIPANAETSRADGSRWGGIAGEWLGEADQMTNSNPKVRQIKLEPHQLGVMVPVTNKLLKNSPIALEQMITGAATDEIAFKVGAAIFSGDGVAKPLGLTNSAGPIVTVSKESGQAGDSVVADNIHKMWGRLHFKARKNARWLINQDVEQQLDALADANGNALLMTQKSIEGPPIRTLKGAPIQVTEFNETLGDLNDIVLADMTGYTTGTRGGVDSAMSMHVRFDFNESLLRFLFEIDGQTWLESALTPFKGSDTLSHFVNLAERT